MKHLLAIIPVVVACSTPSEPAPPPVAATPNEPIEAPAPAHDDVVRGLYVAAFEGDELDECADSAISVTIGEDGVEAAQAKADEYLTKLGELVEDRTTLARPCFEQFANRPHLAQCSAQIELEEGVELSTQSSYFRFESALGSDRRMRECLEKGGDWTALEEDSLEYRRARMRSNAEELREVSRRIDRLTGQR